MEERYLRVILRNTMGNGSGKRLNERKEKGKRVKKTAKIIPKSSVNTSAAVSTTLAKSPSPVQDLVSSSPMLLLGKAACSACLASSLPLTCCGPKKGKAQASGKKLLFHSVPTPRKFLRDTTIDKRCGGGIGRSQMMSEEAGWLNF